VDISFPVYVLAKDCGEMTAFTSQQAVQGFMEPIDVENDEYEAWDNKGNLLHLSVIEPKSTWLKVIKTGTRISEQQFAELSERAKVYAEPEPLLKAIGRKLGWLRASS